MTALLKHDQLFTALHSNTALMAKLTGIWDVPPDNAASPYIEVGNTQEVNDELIDNSGALIYLTLHIWSTYKGRKEILQIRDLILAAMPDWCLYDGIEIKQDSADTNWWHGVLTIRYYDRRNN